MLSHSSVYPILAEMKPLVSVDGNAEIEAPFDAAIEQVEDAWKKSGSQSSCRELIDALQELKKKVLFHVNAEKKPLPKTEALAVAEGVKTLTTALLDTTLLVKAKQKAIRKFQQITAPMTKGRIALAMIVGAFIGALIGFAFGFIPGLLVGLATGSKIGAAVGASVVFGSGFGLMVSGPGAFLGVGCGLFQRPTHPAKTQADAVATAAQSFLNKGISR